MIQPVILSGGTGSRLWPLSRDLYPKQFQSITQDETMLQLTIERAKAIPGVLSPMLVCNEEHRFLAAEQIRKIAPPPPPVVLEPEGKDTAPAITIAALLSSQNDADPTLIILPADHVISSEEAFNKSTAQAIELAEKGYLVTYGITPTTPHTGYGYIKAGPALNKGSYQVDAFVEKPDIVTAKGYLSEDCYYWNSGMFVFKASIFLNELHKHCPSLLKACRDVVASAEKNTDFIKFKPEAFARIPSDSVDFAVMEKTKNAAVVPMDAGWNDVGSWSSVWDVRDKDGDGNVGLGDVITVNSTNNLLISGERLLACCGVDNLVVIDTADAILVADKSKTQDIKKVVKAIKSSGRDEATLHRKVFRPWGNYDSLDFGERFQVKRITVAPGCELSLQLHHHRAEHWIVVSGSALVTKDGEEFLLTENQSTYIPVGIQHRLKNPGVIPLEMIEVQSGSYLGEDDIVRFEDTYGRV